MENTRLSFEDYCKNYINDNIDNYADCSEYGCDLGYEITESANIDGSLTYSTYEAKEYIKLWFDEAGEYYNYAKFNYGEVRNNPFENPELFMVEMVINGVNILIGQCSVVSDNWNDKIELSTDIIEKIKEEIKDKKIEF